MVETLFTHPHVLYQTASADLEFPEAAICASIIDWNGIILLSQEGRHICVNKESVPELVKLLRQLAKGE